MLSKMLVTVGQRLNMSYLKQSNSQEQKVDSGCKEKELEELWLTEHKVQFCRMKSSEYLFNKDVNTLNNTNCTLKVVKMVNLL